MHAASTLVSLVSAAATVAATVAPRAGTTANGTSVVSANFDG